MDDRCMKADMLYGNSQLRGNIKRLMGMKEWWNIQWNHHLRQKWETEQYMHTIYSYHKRSNYKFLQGSCGDIHGSIPCSGMFLTAEGRTAALAELIRAVFSFIVAESTVFWRLKLLAGVWLWFAVFGGTAVPPTCTTLRTLCYNNNYISKHII
jgi:hypothetical protein